MASSGAPNKLVTRWFWTKWEEEVLRKSSVTITINKVIANEHKERCNRVYAVPNYLSLNDIKDLKPVSDTAIGVSPVYIGPDISRSLLRTNLPH